MRMKLITIMMNIETLVTEDSYSGMCLLIGIGVVLGIIIIGGTIGIEIIITGTTVT
jgi:hypothetical protein